MKIIRSSIIVLLMFSFNCSAQVSRQSLKIYRAWVHLKGESLKINGVLYDVSDSSIVISNSFNKSDYLSKNIKTETIAFQEIESIKIRRNNNVGRSMLIGAATGLLTASILVLTSSDGKQGSTIRLSKADVLAIIGPPLTLLGSGIGAISGSVKIKIPIKEGKNFNHQNKAELKTYSIKK